MDELSLKDEKFRDLHCSQYISCDLINMMKHVAGRITRGVHKDFGKESCGKGSI